MSIRPILRWPDPRLAQSCSEAKINDETRALAADLLDTMYDAPGRGLAAPQIGVRTRVCVMDTSWKDGTPTPLVLINPVIMDRAPDLATGPEGCLSLPGVTAQVTRPAQITVSWQDPTGARHSRMFDGFEAACLQHEIDHLDGIMTLDRLPEDARAKLIAAYEAQA